MILLISIALYFVYTGGQIAVIIADFFQGVFLIVVLFVITILQLTTEIFGFFAPARPDIALKISHLPIRTTAKLNSEWIAEFYVIMYSLASYVDEDLNLKDKILWMATQARKRLPSDSYSAKMYDYVKTNYEENITWEKTRDMGV